MKIKKIEKVNPRKVYAIQTSTETFIADGYAHHNCHHCNINLSGNWVEYERAIIKKYGQEMCNTLKAMKYLTGKWSRNDYEEKIVYYKSSLKGLENEYMQS